MSEAVKHSRFHQLWGNTSCTLRKSFQSQTQNINYNINIVSNMGKLGKLTGFGADPF